MAIPLHDPLAIDPAVVLPTCSTLCRPELVVRFHPRRLETLILHDIPHHESLPQPAAVRCGRVSIDPAASIVTRDGVPVYLTPTEWRIVACLAGASPAVVTQRQLWAAAWPGEDWHTYPIAGSHTGGSPHTVRAHLARLRAKLSPGVIVTRPGLGYQIIGEVV